MAKRLQIIFALLTFGLSTFLAGLIEGYRINSAEDLKRVGILFVGDNLYQFLLGYLWISFAMLLLIVFASLSKSRVSRIGSLSAIFLAIFFYSYIIWQKSSFFGETGSSGVVTWAYPIDILIGVLTLILLVLEFFRKTYSDNADTLYSLIKSAEIEKIL